MWNYMASVQYYSYLCYSVDFNIVLVLLTFLMFSQLNKFLMANFIRLVHSETIIPTTRWETFQLPVAQLPEEICPLGRAGTTPQHAPEEPEQTAAGTVRRGTHPAPAACRWRGGGGVALCMVQRCSDLTGTQDAGRLSPLAPKCPVSCASLQWQSFAFCLLTVTMEMQPANPFI